MLDTTAAAAADVLIAAAPAAGSKQQLNIGEDRVPDGFNPRTDSCTWHDRVNAAAAAAAVLARAFFARS